MHHTSTEFQQFCASQIGMHLKIRVDFFEYKLMNKIYIKLTIRALKLQKWVFVKGKTVGIVRGRDIIKFQSGNNFAADFLNAIYLF
jgi:hypothetical protein